jgi:endoglucanase
MFRYNDVKITVNQVGYLTDKAKHAWVVGEINKNTEWDIIHAESGKIVYSGVIEKEGEFDEACAENVTRINFSDFNQPGEYYINLAGFGKSFKFAISENIYKEAFKAAVKSYYFQRSGTDITPVYAGDWAKPASHTNDGYLYEGFKDGKIVKGEFKESIGGWYDAGDFGKKVVPASFALYAFFKMAQYYPGFINLICRSMPIHASLLPKEPGCF